MLVMVHCKTGCTLQRSL